MLLATEWNSLRVSYLQMWNVMGLGVKLSEFVTCKCKMSLATKRNRVRVCYLQMGMLLTTKWNSLRVCYWQMWNVFDSGVKLLKSFLFSNVKCDWPGEQNFLRVSYMQMWHVIGLVVKLDKNSLFCKRQMLLATVVNPMRLWCLKMQILWAI